MSNDMHKVYKSAHKPHSTPLAVSVVAVAASGNVRSSSTPQKTALRGQPHVQVPGGNKQKSWLSSWLHSSSTPPKPCPKDRKRPISGVEGTRARALVFLSPLLLIPGREYLHGDNVVSLHSESYLCSVFVPLFFFSPQADLLQKGRIPKQESNLAESQGVPEPCEFVLKLVPEFSFYTYIFQMYASHICSLGWHQTQLYLPLGAFCFLPVTL